MHVRTISYSALLFFVSALPASMMAQFRAPTDEELKMTADPQAPGAPAVYLDVEEIANDPMHFQTYYARIKVLTEKGRELATQEVPYLKGNFRITDIKGRTIHPDGTIVPLAVKPEDLLISKVGDRQIGNKVFTLPSVEVGSILEFTYAIRYDDNIFSSPSWEIQHDYFVRRAHYQFTPFKSFMPHNEQATNSFLTDAKGNSIDSLIGWSKLPPGAALKTNAGGYYFLDLTDIPPRPNEEYMPPNQSYLYRVFFYYKAASSAQDFWETEGKNWSRDMDRFAEQSKPIRDAVAGLVAPGDSELVKAQKIYKAVEALDNTDYSRRKGESELKQLELKESRRAEDTWKQKSGSSEEIALLYLAMVRSAGLTAYAMKVVARDRGVLDETYLDANQLNDTVILVGIDGKGILVDPGEKMAPFQTVNWRHSEAGGMRQSAKGPMFQTTAAQPYTANATVRNADLKLDEHGGFTGYIQIVMSGQAALHWRQAALRNDDTEVKKQFDQELETMVPNGVEAHVDHFLDLNDPDNNLMAIVNAEGTLGAATSKRLLLPAFFFEARGHTPFVSEEKRQEEVDMHYGEQVSEHVVYHLADGLKVEGIPPDAKIPWAGHAVYLTKSQATPGQIEIDRSLARAFARAKPEEYQDLRAFYQKIAATDQQLFVLTASAP